MPYRLLDANDKEYTVGDTVYNQLWGQSRIIDIQPPYTTVDGSYSFPGRVRIENAEGDSEVFYAMEVGLSFIEDV